MGTVVGVLLWLILLGASLFLYFLPTYRARKVSHPDSTPIFILNLLLGWMLIPWVIALVWAYKDFNKSGGQARREVIEDSYEAAARAVPRTVGHPDSVYTAAGFVSLTPPPEYKKCPFCAEEVKYAAVKCKHCQSALAAIEA